MWGADNLGTDVVPEWEGDVLVVLVPLLEPEVESGGDDGVEASREGK